MSTWEVLDTGKGSAQLNMETDVSLLSQLGRRMTPLIHFYEWEGDAATYGYFVDPSRFLNVSEAQKRGVDLARRPTGGGIVFHIWDLAFSVLVPAKCSFFSTNTLDNYALINRAVLAAVQEFHGEAPLLELTSEDTPSFDHVSSRFCMARPTKYDVVAKGKKVAGAAQRQTKAGFLHQGTISLRMPDFDLLSRLLGQESGIIQAMRSYTMPLLKDDATKQEESDAKETLKHLLTKHLQ